MDLAAELCIPSGEIFGPVILRECDVYRHVLADLRTGQLLFKAGNKHAAAKRQRLLFGGAALKLDAIAVARVVQHDLVAVLCRTIRHRDPARRLLLKPLQLPFHLGVGDLHVLKRAPQGLVDKFHNVLLLCRPSGILIFGGLLQWQSLPLSCFSPESSAHAHLWRIAQRSVPHGKDMRECL